MPKQSAEYYRQYYIKNRIRIIDRNKRGQRENIIRDKNNKLLYSYGLTLKDYNRLLQTQNNICKICLQPEKELNRKLSVDHCHKTNRIRGLLCSRCNRLLGMTKDNPTLLRKAAEYLEHI